MRCPFCHKGSTQVRDSRATEDQAAIRRRRACPQCDARFTTFERLELRELMVLKADGTRDIFDRDKLTRSIQIALRKRPVSADRLEATVNRIVKKLEATGEPDISSQKIGQTVMEVLKELDEVAYVRFASVYKNFSSATDFMKELKGL